MYKEPIGKLISAIHRNTQSIITNSLSDLKIKSGQHDFLLLISKNEGITQKQLGELLYIGKSTTAKAVKSLINSGYVIIRHDLKDKRYNYLYLTEEGKKIAPRIESIFLELINIYEQDFTKEEVQQILNLLKRILKNLKPCYKQKY